MYVGVSGTSNGKYCAGIYSYDDKFGGHENECTFLLIFLTFLKNYNPKVRIQIPCDPLDSYKYLSLC